MVTQMIQHPAIGEVLLNMISHTLSIMDLGLGPTVGEYQAIAIEELSDSED